MSQLTTSYPNLRGALDARFVGMSDAALEGIFANAFGEGVSPAEYEDFFGGLSRALQQVAPVVSSALPGAIQGALSGSAGGPMGMIAGALAGGAGSALQQHGRGPARDVGAALSGGVRTVGALTGGGGAGALSSLLGGFGGRAGGAAGQLLGAISNPDTHRALGALARGGNPGIQVGGSAFPANAFAGLLGTLAREAEAEAAVVDSHTTANAASIADPRLLAALLALLQRDTLARLRTPEAFDDTYEIDESDLDYALESDADSYAIY